MTSFPSTVTFRWRHSAQWRFLLGKKFVAIYGRESQIPHQRQSFIALQLMVDCRQHLPHRFRVKGVKYTTQSIVAGGAGSWSSATVTIRFNRMQTGPARRQQRHDGSPDLLRREPWKEPPIPQSVHECGKIEDFGRIPAEPAEHSG